MDEEKQQSPAILRTEEDVYFNPGLFHNTGPGVFLIHFSELVLPDDPLETMGAWYIRFHVFRTVSIASLLVKGLG